MAHLGKEDFSAQRHKLIQLFCEQLPGFLKNVMENIVRACERVGTFRRKPELIKARADFVTRLQKIIQAEDLNLYQALLDFINIRQEAALAYETHGRLTTIGGEDNFSQILDDLFEIIALDCGKDITWLREKVASSCPSEFPRPPLP